MKISIAVLIVVLGTASATFGPILLAISSLRNALPSLSLISKGNQLLLDTALQQFGNGLDALNNVQNNLKPLSAATFAAFEKSEEAVKCAVSNPAAFAQILANTKINLSQAEVDAASQATVLLASQGLQTVLVDFPQNAALVSTNCSFLFGSQTRCESAVEGATKAANDAATTSFQIVGDVTQKYSESTSATISEATKAMDICVYP